MKNLLIYEEVIEQCHLPFKWNAVTYAITLYKETQQESSDMVDMYCMGGEL